MPGKRTMIPVRFSPLKTATFGLAKKLVMLFVNVVVTSQYGRAAVIDLAICICTPDSTDFNISSNRYS